MNISELKKKLLEEGCNPLNFCIGSKGAASDICCLTKNNGRWSVYYTERGSNSEPVFESDSEAEACEYYYHQIMAMEHRHNVGFFEDEASAIRLQKELEAEGIHTIRNDMPPLKTDGPDIKRVFVIGRDIFKVRGLYKNLPLKAFE